MDDEILKEIANETDDLELKQIIECIGNANNSPDELKQNLIKEGLITFEKNDCKTEQD